MHECGHTAIRAFVSAKPFVVGPFVHSWARQPFVVGQDIMTTDTQLSRIIAHALPGARLLGAEPLGERTQLLSLGERRRVVLRLGGPTDEWAGDPLAAEVAALSALRAEIDLPLPELLAHDLVGETGVPYLLTSYLEGITLLEAVAAIGEEERYALGRALGELMARVHGYTAAAYGPLEPAQPPTIGGAQPELIGGDQDVRYMQRRLETALKTAQAASEIDEAAAERMRSWSAGNLAGSGQPACLVHGDLRPERILLRRRERGWQIAGLTGWGFAQGWRPAWDHVAVMELFDGPSYFGLRVGYGNAYDATTERRYDQLREFALLPYRLALFLEAGRADLALGLIGQTDQDR